MIAPERLAVMHRELHHLLQQQHLPTVLWEAARVTRLQLTLSPIHTNQTTRLLPPAVRHRLHILKKLFNEEENPITG